MANKTKTKKTRTAAILAVMLLIILLIWVLGWLVMRGMHEKQNRVMNISQPVSP